MHTYPQNRCRSARTAVAADEKTISKYSLALRAFLYTYIHSHMCTYTFLYAYIHSHMYTYKHTYTHSPPKYVSKALALRSPLTKTISKSSLALRTFLYASISFGVKALHGPLCICMYVCVCVCA